MTRDSFDEGRSVGERETADTYGAPDEVRMVSDDLSRYVGADRLLPTGDDRRAPIRGAGGTVKRRPGSHGLEMLDGTDVIEHPSEFQVQGLVAEQMAQNVSTAQYDHSHTIAVQRGGMPGVDDYPGGTPGTSGKIKAVHQFGAQPQGHDPVDDSVVGDYLHSQNPLSKYVNAAGLLGQPTGPAAGFARDHERSAYGTMGDDLAHSLLGGFAQQRREAK